MATTHINMHRPAPNRLRSAGRRMPVKVYDADFELVNDKSKDEEDEPLFPSLKRVTAEQRADDIVKDLKEAILNPGRNDGESGMNYLHWHKMARKKIHRAIRDAEMSASMRELMSAKRIGGMCLRIGFMLLAALASFYAFWFGVVFIWEAYGASWGVGAGLSAFALSLAFVVAGLTLSAEEVDKIKSDIKEKFGQEDRRHKIK